MKFIVVITGLFTAAVLFGTAVRADTIKIPEGTELAIELAQDISSKSATIGDRFTVTLSNDVHLADGTVLKAGYRGVGDVIDARGNGIFGKTGKLAVRLLYLRVGDTRVRLRAKRAASGPHNTLLLALPAAPFIKGHNVELKRGFKITAFTDDDTVVALPLLPPPGSPASGV